MRNFGERNRIEYSDREKEYKEYEECVEQLYAFLKEAAQDLRLEGVPVDDACHINEDAFEGVSGAEGPYNIEKDKRLVQRFEKKWAKDKSIKEENIEEERKKTNGEQLEILKTAIFTKFLGEDYIVTRTARYDDIINGIDNLVLDKKTGKPICAIDDVGETRGIRFDEKKEEILDKDKERGGDLKYGLGMKDGKLILGEQKNIPIFYLALPKRYIEKGVGEFIPSRKDKGGFEKKLFEVFKNSILSQISALKLELRLNLEIEESISYFEKVLKNNF